MEDFRKVFNRIPESFDKWRTRYCDRAFRDMFEYSKLNAGKSALEIGPGTGQATEPVLKTGCEYMAIELGEPFTKFMKERFSSYQNFHIVNADFETYDFGKERFDLVYSAATIQWIPEQIAFKKAYDMLRHGGALAMMMTRTEFRSTNEMLYDKIQKVYDEYFRPETRYTCKIDYHAAVNYGFTDFERRDYYMERVMTAAEYAEYIGTHGDHITLQEPYRTKFFDGIRAAVESEGNRIVLKDDVVLYLTRKV